MARKYTSYQMRVAASSCDEMGHSMVAEMLRQAADMMEHETSYEYAVKIVRAGHAVGISAGHYETPEEARKSLTHCASGETPVVVRRAVGDWEEVPS